MVRLGAGVWSFTGVDVHLGVLDVADVAYIVKTSATRALTTPRRPALVQAPENGRCRRVESVAPTQATAILESAVIGKPSAHEPL